MLVQKSDRHRSLRLLALQYGWRPPHYLAGATIVEAIDGDHSSAPSMNALRIANCATGPHPRWDSVTRLMSASERRKISGEENIGKEKLLCHRDTFGNFSGPTSAKGTRAYWAWPRHSHPSYGYNRTDRKARNQQLLCHPVIRVGVVTAGREFTLAEKTISTGHGKRHHHTIANFQLIAIDASADFDHLTHELVAHDVALLHGGNETVIEVQVGAADTSTGNSNDASRRFKISGSGTVSTLIFLRPSNRLLSCYPPLRVRLLLISASPRIGRSGSAKRIAGSQRTRAVGLSINRGNFAVSINALNRRRSCRIMIWGPCPASSQPRAAAPPGGRYSTRAITSVPRCGCRTISHTHPLDLRIRKRTPCNQLVLALVDDFSVPPKG